MPHNTSRVNCRADQYSISDHVHVRYYDDGVPVLSSRPMGYVIDKQITFSTLCCPECGQTGYYDDDSEPVCERCGIILSADGVPRTRDGSPIITDAKSAGRVAGDNGAN